jgi:hypothetical protein
MRLRFSHFLHDLLAHFSQHWLIGHHVGTPELFIHSLLKDVGGLQVLTILNKAVCRLLVDLSLQLFWMNRKACGCWGVWASVYNSVRACHAVFQSGCAISPSHSNEWELLLPTSALARGVPLGFWISAILVASYFPDGEWLGYLIWHLCVFFGEKSVKLCGPFFKNVVVYILVGFKSFWF